MADREDMAVLDANDDEDVAVGGGGARATKARLTLPKFFGTGHPLETKLFIAKVAAYARVCTLDDAQTAEAVSFALEGEASTWLVNQLMTDPAAVQSWDTLRPLMQTRFSRTLTPTERARMVEELKQRPNEKVYAFYDRCHAVQHVCELDVPQDQRTGGRKAFFDVVHNGGVLEKFLRGLREDGGLKLGVNNATGADDLPGYLAVALRLERNQLEAAKRPPAPVIAAVAPLAEGAADQEGQEGPLEEGEIAAFRMWNSNRGRGGSRGTGRGAPGGRGGAAGQARPPVTCWECRKVGHYARDCRSRGRGGSQPGNNFGGGRGFSGGGRQDGGPDVNAMEGGMLAAMQQRALTLGMQQMFGGGGGPAAGASWPPGFP
jgi:hypothetical protein